MNRRRVRPPVRQFWALAAALAYAIVGCVATLPEAGAAQEPLRLPLVFLQPMPVTTIEVGGRRVEIGIDTGGHGSIQLTRAVLADAHAIELADAPDSIGNIYGESRQVRHFRVP
jgi:hypothetical protein